MTTEDAGPDLPDTPDPPKVFPRLNQRLRMVMWLAFIGGPIMIAMGAFDYHRMSKLKTEGERTPGRLFDSNTLDTGSGRTSYRVTLDYIPRNEETTYRKEFFVDEGVYNQARQAGQTNVTYLPSDPTVSIAGDDIPIETEPFAIGGGLIVFALGVWFYLKRQMRKVDQYLDTQN